MLDVVKSSNHFQASHILIRQYPPWKIRIITKTKVTVLLFTHDSKQLFVFFLCNFTSATNSILKFITPTIIYPSFSCPFIRLILQIFTQCLLNARLSARFRETKVIYTMSLAAWRLCFGKKTVSNLPHLLQTSFLFQYCLHTVQTQFLDEWKVSYSHVETVCVCVYIFFMVLVCFCSNIHRRLNRVSFSFSFFPS